MMNYSRFVKMILRLTQALTIMFTCTLLIFGNAVPADAAPANTSQAKSNLTKGSERLDDVQKKSEEILRNPPLSMDRVQAESNKGLNEVQGDADIQNMSRPSNSQQATSIQEKAEQILEKVKGEN
jgi:ABC-type phosphate transport system substrate-binding protein